MKFGKVVTVVMYRQCDGTLELFGIFQSKSDAQKLIAESSPGEKVFFVESEDYSHLIDNLITNQGWEIILVSTDTDKNLGMNDVWGYCITDTVR